MAIDTRPERMQYRKPRPAPLAAYRRMTVQIEMNWETTLPLLLTLYRDGNREGKAYALQELKRMAMLADAWRESTNEHVERCRSEA